MSLIDVESSRQRTVDLSEPIPPTTTVQARRYRGRFRGDKVTTVSGMPPDSTLGTVIRLFKPEELIAVVIGGKDKKGEKIEPVTIFPNGRTAGVREGKVVVPLLPERFVTRRFGPRDRIAFPPRPM